MKSKIMSTVAVIAMGLMISNFAFANEEHHKDASKEAPKAEATDNSMGKMDMGQMHAMMGECMKMHKDGKMCEHNMMEKCQSQMDKSECHQMMKDAKKETKIK